jgi:hypothetical protein
VAHFNSGFLNFLSSVSRHWNEVAVVTTKAKLAGTSSGQAFEAEMRYLRTWLKREDRWQIIAGSASQITPGY